MFSRGTKTMLRNVIRHTDTHNRIIEEEDMWSKRFQGKRRECKEEPRRGRWEDEDEEESHYDRRSPPRDRHNGRDRQDRQRGEMDRRRRRSYDRGERDSRGHGDRRMRSVVKSGVQSACYQVPRAHMDREQPSQSYMGREERMERAERWNKDAVKAEEADPDRWGHSGYKKLYPEEFISSDEEEDFWKRKYTAYYASGTGVKTKEREGRQKPETSSKRHHDRDPSPETTSKRSAKHRRSSSREVTNNEGKKRHYSSPSESPSPKRSRRKPKPREIPSKKRRYRQQRSSSKSSSSSSSSSSSRSRSKTRGRARSSSDSYSSSTS